MSRKSLSEWLAWQESLNPREIDLGLERVAAVLNRLEVTRPARGVYIVAGTNGKGSCAAAIDRLVSAAGCHTGRYSSPHLVRYNERICVAGREVADEEIVAAFERVDAARGDTPLTFFEFGTLAALVVFEARQCDAWILEVGLGGRLDAVNCVDGDVAVITTVHLDHQAWLGDTIEAIAAEKAGVMRPAGITIYGDSEVPASVSRKATDLGAELRVPGQGYSVTVAQETWDWTGSSHQLKGLPLPAGGALHQVRNQGAALAAVEVVMPAALDDPARVADALSKAGLAGRLQRVESRGRVWLLDVAHNPQAAHALSSTAARLGIMSPVIVLGMLADKHAAAFAEALAPLQPDAWYTVPVPGSRGSSGAQLADRIGSGTAAPVRAFMGLEDALEACTGLPSAQPVVVCGSFLVVGPALEWLGLY